MPGDITGRPITPSQPHRLTPHAQADYQSSQAILPPHPEQQDSHSFARWATTNYQPSALGQSSTMPSSDDACRSRPSSAITVSSALADCSAYAQSDASQVHARVSERSSDSDSLLPVCTLSDSDQTDLGSISSLRTQPVVPIPVNQVMAKPASDITSGAAQGLMACLEHTTSIYNLSRTDLETLIAKVIREEGFAKLLEDVDSMWKIKGFLGRTGPGF